jgi:hypothetical protein
MVDGPENEDGPKPVQGAAGPTPQESAESKRLEARRRFLLGGAAALPVILTVTEVKADAEMTGRSHCLSLGGEFVQTGEAPFSGICNMVPIIQ